MLTKKEYKILKKLQTNEYVKSNDFEQLLEVSNKTARKMIFQLDDKLKDYGAHIESKSGQGYLLKIEDVNLFDSLFDDQSESVEDLDSRWEYIVKLFIDNDDYIKIDDIADYLFLTRKVVSNSIKKAEIYLNNYNLTLERKSHYGIRLVGEEIDKRRCMTSIAKNKVFLKLDEKLVTIVNYIFIKYNIAMSQVARDSFIIHVQYSVDRIKEGKIVRVNKNLLTYKDEKFFQTSLFIARELTKLLEDEYSIKFPEEEIYIIAVHITNKKFYEEITGNVILDQEVKNLVDEILESIKYTYRLDFTSDLDIYTMLIKHMIPLRMRIADGSNLKNPLLNDIQIKYPFAMTIANGINPIIEKHFSKKISSDELSYIAIAIQLAIKKNQTKDNRKKNILIVCGSGNISSKLFEYRFLEAFENSIANSEVCSYPELLDYNLEHIDYIFSTVPIDINLPIPVYEIGGLELTEKNSIEIKKMFDVNDTPLLNKFSKQLFFTHMMVNTKEELLSIMCEKSRIEKQLPQNFYELVMKREAMLQTAYGNYVALPHPYRTVSKETFICSALLEKAIDWGGEEVKAVFLVAVSDKKDENLEDFYDNFFEFVLDKENIRQLLENQQYETLIELIRKTKKERLGEIK